MTKLKLLSSVAVAALIAMPAFAQTSPSAPPASRPSTTAPDSATSKLPSDIHAAKVSELVGKNVYNSTNEKVGDINEIVVPKSGGGQAMAVIGVGGFLGIGEKEAAVPLDQLKVQDDKIVAAGLSKEQLKEHADYKKDNYTKLDRNQVVGQASTGSSGMSGSSSSGSSMGSGSSTGSSGSSSSSGSSGSMGSTGSSPSSPPAGNAPSNSGSSTTTPKQ